MAGLRAARVRSKKGGRPRALSAKKTELAYRLYDEKKHTIKEICQMLEISKPALYAYLHRRNTNTEQQENKQADKSYFPSSENVSRNT